LEARFTRKGKDLTDIYTKDRESNVGTKMYTIKPVPEFVLPRLFTPNTRSPALSSFRATVFRGHLEGGGKEIDGLEDVVVDIKNSCLSDPQENVNFGVITNAKIG
jgi:hypothetical protein